MTRARRIREDLAALAVGLAVYAACAVIVSDGKVHGPELAVFHALNKLPGWFRLPMTTVQYLGVAVVPLVAAAIAGVLRRWRLALAMVLVLPLHPLFERVTKHIVERQRPGTSVHDAIIRGDVPSHGLSFPSGHSICAFSMAAVLWWVLPRRAALAALGVALLVGVARVYLGAHNPLDVVGGSAIGLIIGAGLDLVLDIGRDPLLSASGRGIPAAASRGTPSPPLAHPR